MIEVAIKASARLSSRTARSDIKGCQPMTYLELYRRAEKIIERAGCGSPAFDAGCLLGDITGIERGMLPIKGGETAPAALCEKMLDAARQRAAGKPLQYILGRWDFLSLTLEVGEGVLIPRPDTEVLCQTAAGLPKARSPKVVDLCAGSGCVGLGVAPFTRRRGDRGRAVRTGDGLSCPQLRAIPDVQGQSRAGRCSEA